MKKLLLVGAVGFMLIAFLTLVPKEINDEVINPVSKVIEKSISAQTNTPESSPSYYYGRASWYGNEYCNNKPCRTVNGDWFDENKFTCACDNNFPLGSRLAVSFGENSIEVICNDRGAFPTKLGRILDLSKAAFKALAPNSKGVIWVRVKELK